MLNIKINIKKVGVVDYDWFPFYLLTIKDVSNRNFGSLDDDSYALLQRLVYMILKALSHESKTTIENFIDPTHVLIPLE